MSRINVPLRRKLHSEDLANREHRDRWIVFHWLVWQHSDHRLYKVGGQASSFPVRRHSASFHSIAHPTLGCNLHIWRSSNVLLLMHRFHYARKYVLHRDRSLIRNVPLISTKKSILVCQNNAENHSYGSVHELPEVPSQMQTKESPTWEQVANGAHFKFRQPSNSEQLGPWKPKSHAFLKSDI